MDPKLEAALAWADQLNDHMDCHCYDTLTTLAAEVRRVQADNLALEDKFITHMNRANDNAAKLSEAEAALAALREQRCETCRHNDSGDCGLTLHIERSDMGTRFESWTSCETLGGGCRAWARREP